MTLKLSQLCGRFCYNSGMDKRDNLIRFDQMSPERHKELSSAGGKKAAENKRKIKSMQEMLSCMLEAEVPQKQKTALKKEFGDAVDGCCTWGALMQAGIIKAAAEGNVSAYQTVLEVMSTSVQAEQEDDALSKSLEDLGKSL